MLTRKASWIIALTVLVAACVFPWGISDAGDQTDTIKELIVTFTPNSDGSVTIDYHLYWCPVQDFPKNDATIKMGVPNRHFTVESFGGDGVRNVSSANSGDWSGVRIDLNRAYKAGECFNIELSIHQRNMAYSNDKGEVTFRFINPWWDDIPIEFMRVNCSLPADETWTRVLDPQPYSVEGGMATWQTPLGPGQKYTINLAFDQSAFPDFDVVAAVEQAEEDLNIWVVLCIVGVVLVLLLMFLLWVTIEESGGSGYSGGASIGGHTGRYGTGGTRTGSSRPTGSPSPPRSRPSRTGGGGGGFGGRGSSCACVSCACACACAGGSRVGCGKIPGYFIDESSIAACLLKEEEDG